jgi:hypothetical protein
VPRVRCARVLGPAAIGAVLACHGPAVAPGLSERIDRAARACAKVASCAHAHDPPRDRDPSVCVDAWVARASADVEPFERCVASAAGCLQVDACMRARGDAVATGYCRANPGARTGCDGTRLVTCTGDDPDESTSTDCATFGALCGDSPQTGGLLTRACLSLALCPAGAPEVRCDATNAIVGCHDGAVDRTACLGSARCEEHRAADGTSSAICESPGDRHCDMVGKRWCEQGKLVSCVTHGPFGQAVFTDCAALGLACDDHAEAGAACVVPGPAACQDAAPRCEGNALTFCAAGRRFRVACADLGFYACDPDAHGVDAACANTGPAPSPVSTGSAPTGTAH